MPRLEINNTASYFSTYLYCFGSFFDDSHGCAYLSVDDYNRIFGSPAATQLVVGRRVRYQKNGVSSGGIIASINASKRFTITLDDGSSVITTHDFLTFEPSASSVSGQFPAEVASDIAARVEDGDVASILSPHVPLTNAQHDLLRWNVRLGHLPFHTLVKYASLGHLPQHLAKVTTFPLCACCALANATKKNWRSCGGSRLICSESTDFPGGCVSVDQLVSGQTGMIPQSSGKLVTSRFVGATIFYDNFSRFTYVHYMTSLDTDQTLEAKLAFEHVALSHGVTVYSYRADNGRFADSAFTRHCEEQKQELTFCGVGAHHQNRIAECAICSLTNTAHTMLLHAM